MDGFADTLDFMNPFHSCFHDTLYFPVIAHITLIYHILLLLDQSSKEKNKLKTSYSLLDFNHMNKIIIFESESKSYKIMKNTSPFKVKQVFEFK